MSILSRVSIFAVAAAMATSVSAQEVDYIPVTIIDKGENSITVSGENGKTTELKLLNRNSTYQEFDKDRPIVTPDSVNLGDVYYASPNIFTTKLYDNVPWASSDYGTQVINFGSQLYSEKDGSFEPLGQMTVAANTTFYDFTRDWENPDRGLCLAAFAGARGLSYRGTLLDYTASFPTAAAAAECSKIVAKLNEEFGTDIKWPTKLMP